MIFGLITGVSAAVAMYLVGAPLLLGAHPFWAVKVIWIGAAIGLLVSLALWRLPRLAGLSVAGLASIASFGAAHIGKTRFAASYAEDALAGQMWYFGWIATCACIVALAAVGGRVALRKP